jgi:hypothetical protein
MVDAHPAKVSASDSPNNVSSIKKLQVLEHIDCATQVVAGLESALFLNMVMWNLSQLC